MMMMNNNNVRETNNKDDEICDDDKGESENIIMVKIAVDADTIKGLT